MHVSRSFSRLLGSNRAALLVAAIGSSLAAALAGGPGGGGPGAATDGHGALREAGPLTPDAALTRLGAGNERFSSGQPQHPNCDAGRRSACATDGQYPLATILTCSDSRLAAERIFDQGIGDLFVVRVAGNVADTDEIGTIEYGVGHLHTPLLVVMGHSNCGAVKAACSGSELEGMLPRLVHQITPAVATARHAQPQLEGDALIAAAVEANVSQALANILRRSADVRMLIAQGRLVAVGAVYDLESGHIRWLGPHPDQERVLAQLDPHAGAADAGHGHGGTASDAPASDSVVAGMTKERPGLPKPAASQDHAPKTEGHAAGTPRDGHTAGPPPIKSSDALQQLRDGNARFAAGRMSNPRCDLAWLARTAAGQHPFVTVLTCSDSRVPVERVFDQGIGDVFVVRVAGNVADVDEIASIEYAAAHLHTPLLLVLGHTSCGAVQAVAANAELHGCIPQLVDNIAPAVAAARGWNPQLSGPAFVDAAVRANVRQSMQDVLTRSSVVRERVAGGKLMIVGGVYDLTAGTVEWLDDPGRALPGGAPPPTPGDGPHGATPGHGNPTRPPH